MPKWRGCTYLRHGFQNGFFIRQCESVQKHSAGRKNLNRFKLIEQISHKVF
jgi:hypothetical protein